MSTDETTFPLPGWTRDWSKPVRRGGHAYFLVQDAGYDTPCWMWQGAHSGEGYGRVRFRGEVSITHRVVYAETMGPVAADLELDHVCRNRACCNPDHLEPVTHRENVLRGDSIAAQRAKLTHCPAGHSYAGENLYLGPTGGRQCRACRRERSRTSLLRQVVA